MKTYVITAWNASNEPVDDGKNYVSIRGRREGFISWLLAQMRISPIVSLAISGEQILFAQGSLERTDHRIIPLQNVCSTYFGYRKPWKAAILLGLVSAFLLGTLLGAIFTQSSYWSRSPSPGAVALGVVLGIVIGIIYYLLNRTLMLGFVEMSGHSHVIGFKGSVIEGQTVDEEQARYVSQLTQALIDTRSRSAQPAA